MMIQFECQAGKEAEAIDAIVAFIVGSLKIYKAEKLPQSPTRAAEFETLAQSVAKAIRPKASQPVRREALQLVLSGGDTFFDQNGESDPALRNATGAISKALRPFSIWDSPLDLICERRREVIRQGPYKGRYQGTRYIPTRLGKRVREILQSEGAI